MGGNAVFGVLLPSLSAKLWQGSTLPTGLGLRECMKQAGFCAHSHPML